jgi:outer membrane protein assembly factor BamB
MNKGTLMLFWTLASAVAPLTAQPVLDSFSSSGKQTTQTFGWPNTTSSNLNRALIVAGGDRDRSVQSVMLGSLALTRLTSCADPQYTSHNSEIWSLPPGTQPPTGTAIITVTMNGVPRFAVFAAYNLSNADQSNLVDQVACHQNPYGTYFQSESVPVVNTTAHDFMIGSITIPNTSNPADMANWPGIEDINASSFDLALFSHVADTGPAGPSTYNWTWTGAEPDAAAVVTIKPPAQSTPPPTLPPFGFSWAQGKLSDRPAVCPTNGLFLYIATDTATPFWCLPGIPGWQSAGPQAPLAQGDAWAMAFHDSQHTGRSTDIVTPPLEVLWQWKDNHQFDLGNSYGGFTYLPIAYQDKVCFQGGLNANRFICLHQIDRTPAFEADNSGYTQSGYAFQFNNYPINLGDQDIFGSTDYTTTVSSTDGSGFLNIYNTNGGAPYGGFTAWNGYAFQQFVETDDSTENFVLYKAPATLAMTGNFHQPAGAQDYSFRVPAVDPSTQTAYVVIGGRLMTWDANAFTNLWTWGSTVGASPAASNGVVYCYSSSTGTLNAIKSGNVLWSTAVPGALSPIVSQGTVYVGSSDSNFYALDAATGAVLWRFKTGAAFTSLQIPAISGSLIYVPAVDGNIYTLSQNDGSLVSSYRGSVAWGPIIIANGLLFASDFAGTVYAFKPATAQKGM